MAERIAAFDWSTTPLGPINQWPQSLRTVVNILLTSRYAMWMAWGSDLTMLYNDAYSPTLGFKHPQALGTPASSVWTEIWSDIGPRIQTVLTTGKATYDEGLLLFLERSGFPEETYHTFSYSPLADDHGRITGMLCVVTEETDRLIGERRVETLRDVAAALASTKTEEEVFRALRRQLSLNQKDLPFTLTYLFEESGSARLASWSGISPESPLARELIDGRADFPWPARQMFQQSVSRVIETSTQPNAVSWPTGSWNRPAERAVAVPIRQQGQEQPAGFLIIGTNPYQRYDTPYSGFVDLLAGQIAAALGNARAYEAERRRAEALAEIDRAKTTFFRMSVMNCARPSPSCSVRLKNCSPPAANILRRSASCSTWFTATACASRNSSIPCSISRASRPAACRPSMSLLSSANLPRISPPTSAPPWNAPG